MVIDARANVLYAGQEDVGLWRIDLRTKRRSLVERVAEYGVPFSADCTLDTANDPGYGGRIRADVEGVTLYEDYLLVSSQGDNRFFVYDRRTNRPLSSFAVVDGPATDGVQHSDGAAATSARLPGYPKGLLVLHDGENTPDGGRVSTDFKFVDWRSLGSRQAGGAGSCSRWTGASRTAGSPGPRACWPGTRACPRSSPPTTSPTPTTTASRPCPATGSACGTA
jgi:3-phytase